MLRLLTAEDAVFVARLLGSDAEGIRMTARIPEPLTEKAARAWIVQRLASGSDYVFAVIMAEGGQFIGSVGFGGAPEEPSLGYWIGRLYRNRGFATEAVSLALNYAKVHGIRQLYAETFPENQASSRVLVKNGFRFIGVATRNLPARGGIRKVEQYLVELAESGEGSKAGPHKQESPQQ